VPSTMVITPSTTMLARSVTPPRFARVPQQMTTRLVPNVRKQRSYSHPAVAGVGVGVASQAYAVELEWRNFVSVPDLWRNLT